MIREPLIFEISAPGKKGFSLPELDVPEKDGLLKESGTRKDIPGFPQVSEVEVVRRRQARPGRQGRVSTLQEGRALEGL